MTIDFGCVDSKPAFKPIPLHVHIHNPPPVQPKAETCCASTLDLSSNASPVVNLQSDTSSDLFVSVATVVPFGNGIGVSLNETTKPKPAL